MRSTLHGATSNPPKVTVIYHSADYDGLFCREIARKFLPDSELIGWDFGDAPVPIPDGQIYVMDLPVDRVFGLEPFGRPSGGSAHAAEVRAGLLPRVIWIDHHKSSIETHPKDIPGYRIDGVAACRLAWQWFKYQTECSDKSAYAFPVKEEFVCRFVSEPLAVRLAGEYDIWDKRDPDAELFQHGLRSCELTELWPWLLKYDEKTLVSDIEKAMEQGHVKNLIRPDGTTPNCTVLNLLEKGRSIQFVRDNEYRDVITQQGFDLKFEGLTFLACCSHELDIRSHLFAAGVKPHHDALFGFTYTGTQWRVSLYHKPGREDLDLSEIAKRFGGGGHRGACGFLLPKNHPFLA